MKVEREQRMIRTRILLLVLAATLLTSGVASAQYTTTQIPAVPHTLWGAVADDNRTFYGVSGNNAISVLDVGPTSDATGFNDVFAGAILLNAYCVAPNGVAYVNGKLFIESYDNIVVVDHLPTASNPQQTPRFTTISQPFALGNSGGAVATTDGSRVYAISGTTDTLSIIDNTPPYDYSVTRIYVGRSNTDLSVSPDGTRAYLLNSLTAMVTIVDLMAGQVLTTASFAGGRPFANLPADSAMKSDGTLYVSWVDPGYQGHVSVMDRDGNILRILDLPYSSTGIALSNDERLLLLGNGYLIDSGDGHLVYALPQQFGLSGATFSPSGERGFILNDTHQSVMAITGFPPELTASPTTTTNGGTITVEINQPHCPGRLFQIALSSSIGNGGQDVAAGKFPLDDGPLFAYARNPNGRDELSGFVGRIDASGRATATLRVSSEILRNLGDGNNTIYVAYGTFSGNTRGIGNVESISNVVPVLVVR
jgi:DNA-binding beta-propeller fold protein YncE